MNEKTYIRLATELLKFYQPKTYEPEYKLWRHEKGDRSTTLYKIRIKEIKSDSVSFVEHIAYRFIYTSMFLRFSVPKSHILSIETKQLDKPQTIIIDNWAYDEIVQPAIYKLLEDWGEYMYSLINMCDLDMPDLKNSAYYDMIFSLNIQKSLKTFEREERQSK